MGRVEWGRYVAMGDDLRATDLGSGVRAWTVRLSDILATHAEMGGVAAEFVDFASSVGDSPAVERVLTLRPDLVSVAVGSPPGGEHEASQGGSLETLVRRLRESGSDVLLTTSADPPGISSDMAHRRIAAFNADVWGIARSCLTYTLDLWGVRELRDVSMWSADGRSLSDAGHALVARRAAHTLGIPYFELPRTALRRTPAH